MAYRQLGAELSIQLLMGPLCIDRASLQPKAELLLEPSVCCLHALDMTEACSQTMRQRDTFYSV